MTDSFDNRRILIVDDNRAIHQDFQKILAKRPTSDLSQLEAELFGQKISKPQTKQSAFELDNAYSGNEALEKVRQARNARAPYALAFIDVRMPPGWDGIETVEQLWQVDPNLQVILCTAYSDHSWQETFERLGNSDNLLILKKPFEDVEALQMANAMIHKWNAAKQAGIKMIQLEQLVDVRTEKIAKQNQQLEDKITELNHTRAQLIQSEKLAAIGQLAAGIAHEVNNPMGYVHSNLDVLKSYVDAIVKVCHSFDSLLAEAKCHPTLKSFTQRFEQDKQQQELSYILEDMPQLVQEALNGTARVKGIVADLKDFSHMSQAQKSDEDINQLIEQAINISKNETKYHANIIKDFVSLPLLPCWRNRLVQVILNLLINASQAIDKDGQIVIATRANGKDVNITIEDNGSGIAPEHIDKVFDPFFTTKEIGSGSGLGLHICHTIIESHCGALTVASEQGKGTKFTITLPLKT